MNVYRATITALIIVSSVTDTTNACKGRINIVDEQFTRTIALALSVDIQNIAVGNRNAFARSKRRTIAKDQIDLATDRDAC